MTSIVVLLQIIRNNNYLSRGDRGWLGQKSENRPLGFLAVS